VRPTITDDIRDYFEQVEDEFKSSSADPSRRTGGGRIGFQ
jgi:transitional endoplasmic reticulum ATPase